MDIERPAQKFHCGEENVPAAPAGNQTFHHKSGALSRPRCDRYHSTDKIVRFKKTELDGTY